MSHCCEDHESPTTEDVKEEREETLAESPSDENPPVKKPPYKNPWLIVALFLVGALVFNQFYAIEIVSKNDTSLSNVSEANAVSGSTVNADALMNAVLPKEGVIIPISWGDFGKQMVDTGVIDETKFRELFNNSLSDEQEAILSGNWQEPIVLTDTNSRFLLDVFWAFGLANKNDILESGEMSDEKYGGAGKFASTGGWTLASGDPMDHYSKHQFVTLTDEQQNLVDEVSKNIYRPCCGNSTHFPDCNHGMAMLGLLEIMAAEGMTEQEMYDIALQVNSFWFPQTYLDLARYFEEQGQSWDEVDAKLALSQEYSSAQGYSATRGKIQSLPKAQQGGNGCGA